MRSLLAVSLILVAGCAAQTADSTTTTTEQAESTTSAPAVTSTSVAPLPDCPPAPYEMAWLPIDVGDPGLDMTEVEPDEWTSVGGTHSTFYGRTDGTLAIALVRGTLPVIDWPLEKGEVEIDGTRAAVGPHPDGKWVAGWYEAPGARCDLYTMVFYPPWSPADVEQVLLSMNRVGG